MERGVVAQPEPRALVFAEVIRKVVMLLKKPDPGPIFLE